jgi:hypothetical protein
MQPTSHFHNQIIKVGFSIPEHILDDMTPLDASDDMFHQDANPGNHCVLGFGCGGQLLTSGFFSSVDTSGYCPVRNLETRYP